MTLQKTVEMRSTSKNRTRMQKVKTTNSRGRRLSVPEGRNCLRCLCLLSRLLILFMLGFAPQPRCQELGFVNPESQNLRTSALVVEDLGTGDSIVQAMSSKLQSVITQHQHNYNNQSTAPDLASHEIEGKIRICFFCISTHVIDLIILTYKVSEFEGSHARN